jgi:hypothetical protein
VAHEFLLIDKKVKAELANVERRAMVLLGEWAEVPRFDPVLAKLDIFYSLYLRSLLELVDLLICEPQVLVVRQELLILL